ncbi:MAG: oxidoreductase, partial [Nitrospinota bacterium]|nr:oxidoreductase [Nitrospinota bacterium]
PTGKLPAHYEHSIFISFHASFNRSTPAGNNVLRVVFNENGDILRHEDFITGWLRPNGDKSGRPVDLELSPEGDLYLSDDLAGAVYKITRR